MEERKFVMYTGCKTFGWNKISDKEMKLCNNPECRPCNNIRKSIQKAVKEWTAPMELTNTVKKGLSKYKKDITREEIEKIVKEVFDEESNKEV